MSTGKQLKVGILTSGGDAPGMNAVIRAAVRYGASKQVQVFGIKRGYEGLLNAEIQEFTSTDLGGIIRRGGTVLLTARCPAMMEPDGQRKAAEILKVLGFDALIVVGGDGSFAGALALSKLGVNVVGVPATIDLDIPCTDYSIGFDTAINTGMEAINRILDTSMSHERCSVVEVMGRDAGFLALWCGLTGGAEEVLIPEYREVDTEAVIKQIIMNRARGKKHNLVVVAEGVGGSVALAKEIQRVVGIESRATILGHLQRGGAPTAIDRMHGSVMGCMAIDAIVSGERNKTVVVRDGKHMLMDLEEALQCKRDFDRNMYDMVKALAI